MSEVGNGERGSSGTGSPGLRYDGVLFDVGGTLIGFHDPAPFREFLHETGLPAGTDEVHALQRRLYSVLAARREQAVGLGADEESLYGWWRNAFAEIWPEHPDRAAEMHRWLLEGRFDRLYGDVRPALDDLQRLGLRLGVVSNFGPHLEALLQRLRLRRYFEFVVVSALAGLAKPDPRIFDLAVAQIELAPDRLLYVGDHIGDDIEGAWAAGLDAVLIDRHRRHLDSPCSRIVSLDELRGYVQAPEWPARAVILDMDGVVLDSPPVHLETWQRTLAPYGVVLDAEAFFLLEGMPTERTAQVLTERYLGRACPVEEAADLAAAKRAHFARIYRPALVPGMLPLLYNLHGRGCRLGLVTGSARRVVEESLEPTGVAGLFDAIVTGDEVGLGKPDPEPYRLALERLGLGTEACLAIENAPLGIRSAQAAGIRCAALETTLPAARLRDADWVFGDVQALRDGLLRL